MARVSLTDIYKLLPGENCGDCDDPTCMAFAAHLIARETDLEKCPLLKERKHRENAVQLEKLLTPPIREVVIGSSEKAVVVGGEEVMYRHELTFFNPTAIALDIHDEMNESALIDRINQITNFVVERMGQSLQLDMIAVRSKSGDPGKFQEVVQLVAENTDIPLILVSFNPAVLEAGVSVIPKNRPLLYAATKDNWQELLGITQKYKCPLVVSSPADIDGLIQITSQLLNAGFEDIIIDLGSGIWGAGLSETLNNFVMARRAAIEKGNEKIGFPTLAVPATIWLTESDTIETTFKEAALASIFMNRYADILILHSLDGWALLPSLTLRQNIYTDPRQPVSVDQGLYSFGEPNEASPVLLTTNFALTYHTVAGDIEAGDVDCYLLVVDTEGIGVETSVAGDKLKPRKVAELIKETHIGEKVTHKKLIIPALAARLQGEIEDQTGWEVVVGPQDSSQIPAYIEENWKSD